MLIIGIAGGAGSGKTTVVRKILEQIPEDELSVLPQDAYYFDLGHLAAEERLKTNFDHPDSIEFELFISQLTDLMQGKEVEQPIYSYQSCTRQKETKRIKPRKIIIIEGILVLCNQKLRDLMNLKVFVDTEADERLIRILKRDFVERDRPIEKTIERYNSTVKPMHTQFIEPTKRFADLIVPGGGANKVAIDIITNYIQSNM